MSDGCPCIGEGVVVGEECKVGIDNFTCNVCGLSGHFEKRYFPALYTGDTDDWAGTSHHFVLPDDDPLICEGCGAVVYRLEMVCGWINVSAVKG